jgi:hypothetical protein
MNDLQIFKNEEYELKSILDKSEMEAREAAQHLDELNKYRKIVALQNSYVSDTVINKKLLSDDLKQFYNQFTELEVFLKAMLDYSTSVS